MSLRYYLRLRIESASFLHYLLCVTVSSVASSFSEVSGLEDDGDAISNAVTAFVANDAAVEIDYYNSTSKIDDYSAYIKNISDKCVDEICAMEESDGEEELADDTDFSDYFIESVFVGQVFRSITVEGFRKRIGFVSLQRQIMDLIRQEGRIGAWWMVILF